MIRLAAPAGCPPWTWTSPSPRSRCAATAAWSAPPVTTMRLVRYRTTDLTRLAKVDPDRAAGRAGADRDRRRGGRVGRARWRRRTRTRGGWRRSGWAGLAAVGRAAARRPAGHRARRVRRHRVHRPARSLAGPVGRRSVLPAARRRRDRHGLHGRAVRLRRAAAGHARRWSSRPASPCCCPGCPWSARCKDAISTYYVTAAGGSSRSALLSAGLLTGVVLGLKLGLWFGLTLNPAEAVSADFGRFGISAFAAATAAGMFALAGYAPLRSLLAAGLAGGAGWVVYGALTQFAEVGPVVATGVAATVVGLATGVSRRGSGVHSHVITLGRHHPAATRADRLPGLLPAGRRGRGRRAGHGDPRAGHRPRARRGRRARRLRRPPPDRDTRARRTARTRMTPVALGTSAAQQSQQRHPSAAPACP